MIFIIFFLIKIRIIYLFIKYFIYSKGILNRVILFILLFLYCVFNIASAIPNKHHHVHHSKTKSCYSNIRVLQGAVEMYNMDNPEMMTNKLDMKLLVEKKYIRSAIEGPEKECRYQIEGDMTDEGYVYCTRHGDIAGDKPEVETINQEDQKNTSTNILESVFSTIWSWEVKIDKFFISLFSDEPKTAFGTILFIIFLLFGFWGEACLSCGGVINSIICIIILSSFGEEKEEIPLLTENIEEK